MSKNPTIKMAQQALQAADPRGRAWVEVNLPAFRNNISLLSALLPKGCKLMPVVKANAYGHGAIFLAQECNRMGIRDFCVATATEGAALRENGVQGQILVLGCTQPSQMELLTDYRLTQTVVDAEYADWLEQYAARAGESRANKSATGAGRADETDESATGAGPVGAGPILVHVGVDTGMHRLGEPWDHFEQISGIWDYPHLKVTGLFSHCCMADGISAEERAFTLLQAKRLEETVRRLRDEGKKDFICHLLSSYGVFQYPKLCYDRARVGIALYGVLSSKGDLKCLPEALKDKNGSLLSPVLSMKTRIAAVKELRAGEGAGYGLEYVAPKDTRLAILSSGYGDGIPRNLGCGRGFVLIGGHRAPIAGRICMDQMAVELDTTEEIEAARGGEAVLIGASGREQITVMDWADWSDTISNEILSRLGARPPRIYIDA